MKKTIFYSWQSDLENSTNRSFIQNCIERAIKEMNREHEYAIDDRGDIYSFDKDTLGEGGTPHIADTIFTKISKSSFFIADISIVNHDYSGRKTPNPNVLIELGYAAKSLGWDRIICIFNKDFGSIDDLPFDLRFRRPLLYSLSGQEKDNVKTQVVDTLKYNIKCSNAKNMTTDADDTLYLVIESDTLESFFERKIQEIFGMESIKKKYSFISDNYSIEMWDNIEDLLKNKRPWDDTDIETYISIVFNDDRYSHNEYKNQECSILFTFQECFKQINFIERKVYSAFRISRGYSPSGLNRNYDQLSYDILKYITEN